MTATVLATHTQRARVLSTAVAEAARRLDMTTGDLGRVIGLSQSSVSRLMRGHFALAEGTKTWEAASLFIRLYRGLVSILGNSDDLARTWLRSPNRIFGDEVPLVVIQRIDGLVHACEYVDAHRAPA